MPAIRQTVANILAAGAPGKVYMSDGPLTTDRWCRTGVFCWPAVRENVMRIVPVIKSSDLQRSLHFYTEVLDFVGIPVKVNIDSGGKPNGVPE